MDNCIDLPTLLMGSPIGQFRCLLDMLRGASERCVRRVHVTTGRSCYEGEERFYIDIITIVGCFRFMSTLLILNEIHRI